MGIAVFFLLALGAAAAIAYPLLPGRLPRSASPALTDGDIEQAVGHLRRSRSQRGRGPGPACPACGAAYQPGDRFCVRCGADLPSHAPEVAPTSTCPACSATVRAGDQFCAKCGQTLAEGGAA